MSLNDVTLTGTLPGAAGAVAIFVPSGWLTDSADELLIPPNPVRVILSSNPDGSGSILNPDGSGSPGVPLLATDNSAPVPAGWTWTVIFTGIAGVAPEQFSFPLLFAGGAEQDISAVTRVVPSEPMAAYMLEPTGTPTAGDAPVATGPGGQTSWLPVLLFPSGDTTGATDSANIAAALTPVSGAIESARIAPGNWWINAPITAQSNSQSVLGPGKHAARINAATGFTGGPDMLSSGGFQFVTMKGFSLVGPSSGPMVLGGLTQLNGLEKMPGVRFTARDIHFSNLNGWAFFTDNSGNDSGMTLDNLSVQNCAGGYHLLGNHAGQAAVTMTACEWVTPMGTTTGPAAGLQPFQVEDYEDLVCSGPLAPTVIKGACSSLTFTGIDSAPPTPTQPAVLIEDGTNGSPSGIVLDDGIIQDGTIGVQITGGAFNVTLGAGLQVAFSQGHGVSVEGTGGGIKVLSHLYHNGKSGVGPAYDLNWQGTSTGVVGAMFDTAIGSGVGFVAASAFLSASAAGGGIQWGINSFPQGGVTGTRFAGTQPPSVTSTWPPVAGQFLCPLTSYAPASQTLLSAGSATMAVPGMATTVAAGSNGGEISGIAAWASPSGGVLDVAATAGFPSSGTLLVVASGSTVAVITYTGTSGGNSFTGCAYVSGSATGTVATGGIVALSGAAALISTGPFVAPPSGSVLVRVEGLIAECTASSTAFAVGLAAHGTVTPMIGDSVQPKSISANVQNQTFPPAFPVTGLTPGASYDFDLLASCSAGNMVTFFAFGQTSTTPVLGSAGVGAPIVMTVQAA